MSQLAQVRAIVLASLLSSGALRAQAAPPSTDIYLAPVRVQNGRPVVGTPVNVTNRPGYDNQPSFTPDSRAILYTSTRADGQADIYRYDLGTKGSKRLTSTAESEYSATVYGDGGRFSVIRVERDSTQRLWSFRLDGSDPQLLFPEIKPVGYHVWVDSTTVAMFLLGKPNALVIADTRVGRPDTLARDIGRSLVALPRGNGFSFVQHAPDSSWILTAVDVRGNGSSRHTISLPLTRLPAGSDYIAWWDPAVAISGAGSKLLLWNGTRTKNQWTDLADLTRFGLHRISRLALSPDRKWLAIVAE